MGIIGIYSYSNIFFILGAFFTLIGSNIVNLVIIGICGFLSLIFINMNYSRFLN